MAPNHKAYQLALREKARTLSVCTTGSITMAATATGYTRLTGSFIADGFAPGMEITPSDFTSTPRSTITSMGSDGLSIVVKDSRSAESAGAGRTLSVGLPSSFAKRNLKFTPVQGVPYVEEDYLPGPSGQSTIGPLGELELFPIYVLKLYVPENTGLNAEAGYTDAILDLFAPRTAIAISGDNPLRVRSDSGPYAGQSLQSGGFSVTTITIPLRIRTANTI